MKAKLQIIQFLSLAVIGLLVSCSTPTEDGEGQEGFVDSLKSEGPKETLTFEGLLDSQLLSGAILIYDQQNDEWFSNDFERAKEGRLPASTFKIPNSLVCLENGVVENDSSMIYWGGEPRRMEIWEQDMTFREAFQFSCLPCYQELAVEVGEDRMRETLELMEYPRMVFDSTSLNLFWVDGESRINNYEQINFIQRLQQRKLPLKESTYDSFNRMFVIEESTDYTLYGKTGWSIQNDQNNGWFVGYVAKKEGNYFFATNVDPMPEFEMENFGRIRKEVSLQALKELKIL